MYFFMFILFASIVTKLSKFAQMFKNFDGMQ